ncbi:hypothetical protein [Echinicola soli]|uniref:hypothetical protein n=1 Tax=Echinicola soli TaxID=2591634 RepID=UPI00143D69CC|nr:hypothetical protein [Echinicola soli]
MKKSYPQLTEMDLSFEFGKEDELIDRIAKRLDIGANDVMELMKRNNLPLHLLI